MIKVKNRVMQPLTFTLEDGKTKCIPINGEAEFNEVSNEINEAVRRKLVYVTEVKSKTPQKPKIVEMQNETKVDNKTPNKDVKVDKNKEMEVK